MRSTLGRKGWTALLGAAFRAASQTPTPALLAAVGMALYGGLLLHGGWYANFDRAALWLTAALAALVVASWTGRPRGAGEPWIARLRTFWSDHWWEVSLLLGVLAAGAFLRSFRFGEFPPPDGLWLVEENNNGGNAYAALHMGERRIDYAATHLLSTLGVGVFGSSAVGLRLPFLIFSIVSLVPFYLALRELVSARAALFGLALFSVARWAIFASRIADDPFLVPSLEIWLLYFMMRAAKHGTPGSFLGLGVTSALISYEYMGYRHLPALALALIVAVWGWRLLVRARADSLRPFQVARLAVGASWRQALILLLSFFIVIAPMAFSPRGSDFYLEPYRRQSSDREAAGVTGLLAEDWQDRLKWGVEVFAPFAPQEFPDAFDQNVPGLRYFDPATAFLLALALLYVLVWPRNPYGVFFAAYFSVTLVVGAIFPLRFVVYRFTTLLPIIFILIALLVHDAGGLWDRVVLGRVRWLLPMLLVALVVYAGVWNGRVFFGQFISNTRVQAEYYNGHFAFCKYARGLGPGVFFNVYSHGNPLEFIFAPRSDYAWVCSEVNGQPVPTPGDLRPVQVSPGAEAGAAVFLRPTYPLSSLTSFMQSAYPTVTEPSAVLTAPDGTPMIVSYVVPADVVASRQGLLRRQVSSGSTGGAAGDVVDRFPDVRWPAEPVPGAVRRELRWEGLLRTEGGAGWTLLAESEVPVVIMVDGRVTYSTVPGIDADASHRVADGWHAVTVVVQRDDGDGSLSLRWVGTDGTTKAPSPEDFLAASQPGGLVHHIRLRGSAGDVTVQRLAPFPSLSAVPGLERPDGLYPGEDNPQLVEQVWSGTWDVKSSGTYSLQLATRGGTAFLQLDGLRVMEVESSGDNLIRKIAQIRLEAGPHRLDIVHRYTGGIMAGVQILAGLEGETVQLIPLEDLRAY